jgi:P4 family phage/plasmid primase-like protien
VPIDTTLLTNKKGASNAASPEKLKLKGRRMGVLNEPEGDDSIKVGQMKELTGADTINARGLFKDPISFKPQFKLFMLCNKKPVIPSADGGTWRRIRVVPFEMKFVDNPKSSNERKIDRTLERRMGKYAEVFMSMLVDEYKKFKEEGIPEPEKVKLSTNQYQQSSDLIAEFIDDRLVMLKNGEEKTTGVTLASMHDEYKRWIKEQYNNERKPLIKNDFKLEMENRLGAMKSTKAGWVNIKWNSNEEEPEEEIPEEFEENEIQKMNKKKTQKIDV